MKFVQELDRQVPLMDEIDTKVINFIKLKNVNADWNLVIYLSSKIFFMCLQVDKATSDLKNTNVRLKDTVNQVT